MFTDTNTAAKEAAGNIASAAPVKIFRTKLEIRIMPAFVLAPTSLQEALD
jgi:hypothetical protein